MELVALFKVLKIIFAALPWLISVGALHQFLYNKFQSIISSSLKNLKNGEIRSGN